jgi:hypothetical protein
MTIAAYGEQIIRIKHASFQWDQWGDINGDGLANAEADRWRIKAINSYHQAHQRPSRING